MNNGDVPAPRTQVERDLEKMQRRVVEGLKADTVRRQLIAQLYQGGMSQVEIAARCSRASEAAGGQAVGVDGIQKLLRRMRVHRDEKALKAARKALG